MEQDTIENWKQRRPETEDIGEAVCLWLVHIETGRYLDDSGGYCGPTKYYEFECAEAAGTRKDELLELFPFASVHIGRPDDSQSTKYNSPRIGDFTKEKRRWMSWNSLGFFKRWRRSAPTFTAFDPATDPSVNE
ncbi:MAG: hypothetical protein ACPGVU_01820 [Limisphaerales bacterium]